MMCGTICDARAAEEPLTESQVRAIVEQMLAERGMERSAQAAADPQSPADEAVVLTEADVREIVLKMLDERAGFGDAAPTGAREQSSSEPEPAAAKPEQPASETLPEPEAFAPIPTAIPEHDGSRFAFRTPDNRFRLQFTAMTQLRYLATFGADSSSSGTGPEDDDDLGFQFERIRFGVRGHLFDPKLTYRLNVDVDSDGDFTLLDGYATYDITDALSLRFGRFKPPFDREFFGTSATLMQAVDRSLLDAVFRINRTEGVQLSYTGDRWRGFAALTDGAGAASTNFTDSDEADIALSARSEFRLGDAPWRQFRDMTAFRGDKAGFLLGAGLHWQEDGRTFAPPNATGQTELLAYTADISFESDGWNMLAAVHGRVVDDEQSQFHDIGLVAQGGLFISDQAELFTRYAHIWPDDARPGNTDDFGTFTAGMNYYFVPNAHTIKLSAELSFSPFPTTGASSILRTPDTGSGLLSDDSGSQFGLAVQMQLMF